MKTFLLGNLFLNKLLPEATNLISQGLFCNTRLHSERFSKLKHLSHFCH
ncbi:hypothetical protein CpecG_0090 [Chlamydia pecorum MC/MarsBar]|nr:hypothetical protein CpecS_0092 [Chlamydia pecorum VR629]ETF38989.1 hypothetical protein CpecF_0089 [Chlamydia pecorum DBDeUG]ETF39666.1 hypothetical protein CpecG_0090 [Chlamydia pecorum MC/MarsBar]ETF40715.1 hypothetical protein CpecA_0090 [Chlamydia pecorum IPTaLE]